MTEELKIDAYWFTAFNRLPHGDGRLITIGKTHHKHGEIIICRHGFHASREPYDALRFAPGHMLYKVQLWGDVQEQDDKLCARHRTYLAARDATDMLRRFACRQALTCIDKWNAPQVVRDYLETGSPALRSAAESAALNAAWNAALSAAESAARSAAESATESVPWSAAWGTAESATLSAAWSAAENAAWSAAWKAALISAESAARQMFNEMAVELF